MDNVLPGKLIPVTEVEVIGDYQLRLTFKDGIVGDVSFVDREWNGIFKPLCDPKRFAQVTIEFGTIVWPNDGLDMAPETLYERACRHQVDRASASA